MRDKLLVFGQPQIAQPEIDEVLDSMLQAWLGTGPKVALFEREFAAYKGVHHAVAVNSCTAAMHLALRTLDLREGDEVITTPMTFCATVNAIIHSRGTPVLADVEAQTMNLDPAEVRKKITPRTKAIVPVHFAGRPCRMEEFVSIASEHGLAIVEDCAHAIESEYRGRKTGTFGDFGCFSFYVTKNVVTGEGGMVLPATEQAADRIKTLALHGMSRDAWKRFSDEGFQHYDVVEAGFKYNMMDLQAAIGIHQLRRVEENWKRREKIWGRYQTALSDLPIDLPSPPDPATRHAYHLFTIMIDEARTGITRDQFLDELTRQKIGVGVHYRSIPDYPYYRSTFGWCAEDYPNAYRIGRQTLSLPLSPRLTGTDVDDVIEAIRRILAEGPFPSAAR
ncbi:MAG: DegT/DnrJ/EryC1/StrS family aminotransferase [Acidobacteria bacterium]|nr:DegT/DnrJ/EryC1/StrS family aminotransferase [Acidobacteriota bacterium]